MITSKANEPPRVDAQDVFRLRTHAHVALLDWLEACTGLREVHDQKIVDAMQELVKDAQ